MDLHSLLDHIEWVHKSITGDGGACTTRGYGDGQLHRKMRYQE
jgi:hypothetical protein